MFSMRESNLRNYKFIKLIDVNHRHRFKKKKDYKVEVSIYKFVDTSRYTGSKLRKLRKARGVGPVSRIIKPEIKAKRIVWPF